jgi:large subunit ribosomal protein L10Ae
MIHLLYLYTSLYTYIYTTGKFPTVLDENDNLQEKIETVKATIKFQMKKVVCMSLAVANVDMSAGDISLNVQLSVNFLVSLLKKNWQNIKVCVCMCV